MNQKIATNISGLSEGLKCSEAADVKFVKSDQDEGIQTLHIVWDAEPAGHKGVFLKATELGAPDPILFEESLLQFFYITRPVKGSAHHQANRAFAPRPISSDVTTR